MSNKIKDIDIIRNHIYFFFDDIIKIKNFDPNNIKIDEKSYMNILIYYIGYAMIKNLKYINVNSVNPIYLVFSTVNRYFVEINGNKYLTLVPTNESRQKKKKKKKKKWRTVE